MPQKIFIHRFHCLNNYGSAMMGLVVLENLRRIYGNDTQFFFDSNGFSSIDEINAELSRPVRLQHYALPDPVTSRFKWVRSYQKRKYIFTDPEIRPFDLVVVLGGDDLSEYYTYKIYRDLLRYWRWSKNTRLVLLGQSIGPFERWRNRMVMRLFFRNIPIYARDPWTVEYLKKEFGLHKNVFPSTDLAFADLPLQNDRERETRTLQTYGLTPDTYATFVISGLQGKYYTPDRDMYFSRWREFMQMALQQAGNDFRFVLLAHTFPPHANEAALIRAFVNELPGKLRQHLVAITDKIGPTAARHILGNGRFTLTGRMHAAVSTFQMGKPAVSLAYSAKYKGVLGGNLGRNDLIIWADEPSLWHSGEISRRVEHTIQYLHRHYERLTGDIRTKAGEQKKLIENLFARWNY